MAIEVRLGGVPRLEAELGAMQVSVIGGTPYNGPYAVTPATYREQVLATKNKSMREDVTVGKIPVYEVSNTTGGLTLTIGMESLGG